MSEVKWDDEEDEERREFNPFFVYVSYSTFIEGEVHMLPLVYTDNNRKSASHL